MRLIFKDKNFNSRNSFRIQRTEVIWISRSFYTKFGYSSSIPIVSFLKKASEIRNQWNGSQDSKLLSQPVDNKVVPEFNFRSLGVKWVTLLFNLQEEHSVLTGPQIHLQWLSTKI